ncbi:MAG: hypothetical protein WCI74_00850 [Actinomycetes bacterium]
MSRSHVHRNLAVTVTIFGLGAAALAGCSSGSTSPTTTPTSPIQPSGSDAPTPPNSFPVEFAATLTSSSSRIVELGTDNPITYGVSTLDGRTTINKSSVGIKMQATFDLKNSSGQIGGFLELKWGDGTILALRQAGTAEYDTKAKETIYDTRLEVVGASSKAAGTTGTGTLKGSRSGKTGTTGGSIKINVTLNLVNAPSSITGDSRSRGSQSPSTPYTATIAP